MASAKKGKAKNAAAAGDARIIDAAATPGGGNDLFALFMRHSPVYTYIKEVTPTESRVLQASDNFEQMIGIPGADMLGKTMAELFPPEFAAKITADDWAVVSNGKVLKLDEDLNGRHYITIKFPIVQGGKNLLAGYTIDITQQKQAEEALREREETYRALLAGLPDVVSRFDREGRHLFISDNIRETGDFDAAHMTGKTHRELGYPEAQCRFWEQAITQVFDSGLPFETEYAFIGRKGPATHNWRLMPERDAQGVVRSVLSISRDITAHRQVEQDYHMLFKQMMNGFALHEIICDPQGRPIDYRYLAVNPAFERMTGLKAKDLVGRTVREALPGIEQHWIDTFGKVALTGEPAFFENYSADLKKYFEVTAFRPAANQFACIFADITERKRAEEDLKRQTRLQQLLIQISSAYINQPLESVKAAIRDSLRDLAAFVGADRAYIFDYDFQRQICTNTYEWCGAGIEPQIETQQAMPLAYGSAWVAAHRAGLPVHVPDVSALPPSKGREILEAQGIKSLLAVPLMHAGECIGFVGFDSVKQHHAYPDHEQRLLAVFAEMLVNIHLRKQADAALKKSEEQYRLLTENIQDVVWTFDTETMRFLYVSPSVERQRGYTPEEIIAEPLTTAHLVELIRDRADDFRSGREPPGRFYINELELPCKDGSAVWTEVVTSYYINPETGRVEVRGVTRDITERRRAEEALRASEERLVHAQAVAHIGNWELDLHSRSMWASEEALRIYGLETTSPHLKLERVQQMVIAEDRPRLDAALQAFVQGGIPYNTEFRIVRANDGTQRVIHSLASLERGPDGTPSKMIGTVQDITERKRAEDALQQERAILDSIIDLNPYGVQIFDAAGHHVRSNQAFLNMFQAVPPADYCFFDDPISDKAGFREAHLAVKEGKSHVAPEVWYNPHWLYPELPDKLVCFRSSVFPIMNAAGKMEYCVVMFEDITERKQAEAALQKRELDLAEAQRISHIGSWEWDLASNKVEWSDEMYRIFGLTPDTFDKKGESLLKVIHPDDVKRFTDSMANNLSNTISFSLEYRVIHKDGAVRTVLAEGRAVHDESGKAVRMIGTVQDITERKRIEDTLRANEAHLKHAQEVARMGSYVLDIPAGMWESSGKLDEIFGIDAAYVRSVEGWTLLIHPEWRQMMADYFTSHVLGQRGRFDKEYKIIRKNDGAERWVHGLGELEFDERNQPVRMVGTIQDITERKQAETALRESLLFRREAEKIARIGAWKANPKTDHLYWTEGVYEIVEAPPEYKPGLEEGMKFYTAATIPVLREALHRALEHGTPFVVDVGLTTMTGRHIWTEVRGLGRITEDEGAFVIGTIQDVTERMRVESAMREREEKFRNLFNNAEVGMFRSRLDGSELLDLNDKYLAMLGLTREEAVGKPAGIIWADPEERKEMVKTLQANGRVNNLECRMKKKDGSVINCIVSARLYPEQGIVEGSVIDITARKRAEAEKERLEEQLQQAQKMESVGRLAGGVAHDFNNMLGVILGHADLALEQMAADHPVHADLAEIRKAAGRSADLTRQLLAFARKQTIAPKVLDLNETVEGMLNMLRRLIGEDIQLNWHPGAELWPAKVDSSQIDQILTNLCVNARDAISGVGQITIETGNTTFDAAYCTDHAELVPGDYVRLSVSDSGCGMDKETLSHLFEPFFTTKGVGRGTGLGLATVYGAVKQNNGFISTCSEPGQGTMITIHLPRHAEKSGQAQNESPVQPDVRGRETILLAEDEPSILKLTTTMLEKLGYTVLAASTPGEAIRLAREHTGNVHLLITDVVMPEMNGRDLAKNVLSIYPDIGRLFMSGYTADVIAHHGVLDEGVYFIQKPFAMKELAAKVRETLDAG